MRRLSQLTLQERDKQAQDIKNAQAELNAEIERYNEAMRIAFEALKPAIEKYNETLHEVDVWRTKVFDEIEEYVDARSDKWKESDTASAYEDWKQAFENIEVEPFEPEEPSELELYEPNVGDDLDALPEAPDL